MMERRIYPVSQVNRYVKAVLAQDRILSGIWVSGEISNYKRHSTGHRYFTIKDAEGAISAVMFSSYAQRLEFRPEEGMHIVAFGEITLYEKTGQYQIYVKEMELMGAGALYQAYLALKEKLEKQGLFDAARKKPIPKYARTIGIITSPTGAAVRDMIQTARRRYPGIQILFCPALVQGPGASDSIIRAIRAMNADGRAEVLLVGRGGGSIEDLWAFNEEPTVRAIAGSGIPVISAVGHETDFTLADFAADLRAATPTAAAELAVPLAADLQMEIAERTNRIRMRVHEKLDRYRKELSYYMDRTAGRMLHLHIRNERQLLDMEQQQIRQETAARIAALREHLQRLTEAVTLLDPAGPLKRGYSLLEDADGIITSVSRLVPGMDVTAVLHDGRANLTVKE